MQVNIRGINTGRDAETNFALVVDGVLQTNPNALNQELVRRHADRDREGPARRAVRPKRGRRRADHDHAQTRRRMGRATSPPAIGSDTTYKGSIYVGGPIGEERERLALRLHPHDRRAVGEPQDRLRRLCRQVRGVRRLRPAAVRSRRRRARLQGEVLRDRCRARSTSMPPSRWRTRRRFSVRLRFTRTRTTTISATSTTSSRRTSRRTSTSRSRATGTSGFATLTSYVAYNDQTNFFLTDGTSDAFRLYAFDATGTCPATNDANLTDPGLRAAVLRHSVEYLVHAGRRRRAGFLPPYSPIHLRRLPVPAARPGGRSASSCASRRPATSRCAGWAGSTSRTSTATSWSRRARTSAGLPWPIAFVPTSGPNPTDLLYDDDFSSKVYAVFGQLALRRAWTTSSSPSRCATTARTARSRTTCRPAARRTRRPATRRRRASAFVQQPATSTPPTRSTRHSRPAGIPDRIETFEQLQPKVSTNWELTDDFALFASYGYGFRSGGFNSSGSAATVRTFYGGLAARRWHAQPARRQRHLRKEVSKAAELGFKSFFARPLAERQRGRSSTPTSRTCSSSTSSPGRSACCASSPTSTRSRSRAREFDCRWKIRRRSRVFGGYAFTDGNIDEYDGPAVHEGQRGAVRAGVHRQPRRRGDASRWARPAS